MTGGMSWRGRECGAKRMIGVLFSGGVDSFVHLTYAISQFGRSKVVPVYFDVGQRYASREWTAAQLLGSKLGIRVIRVQLSGLSEDPNGYIPLRNLRFILQVAGWESSEGVVFGMLKGEYPPDKNPKFVKRVQALIDTQFEDSTYQGKRKFSIETPFADSTKVQMVRWYLDTPLPMLPEFVDKFELLGMTQACYKESLPACGQCMSCFNRWVAWTLNGIEDEPHDVHPAKAMIDRLVAILDSDRSGKPNKDSEAVFTLKALHRLPWALEVRRALNNYCKKEYGLGIFSVLRDRISG